MVARDRQQVDNPVGKAIEHPGKIGKAAGELFDHAALEHCMPRYHRTWRGQCCQCLSAGRARILTVQREELAALDMAVGRLDIGDELEQHLFIGTRARPDRQGMRDRLEIKPDARLTSVARRAGDAYEIVFGDPGDARALYAAIGVAA